MFILFYTNNRLKTGELCFIDQKVDFMQRSARPKKIFLSLFAYDDTAPKWTQYLTAQVEGKTFKLNLTCVRI